MGKGKGNCYVHHFPWLEKAHAYKIFLLLTNGRPVHTPLSPISGKNRPVHLSIKNLYI